MLTSLFITRRHSGREGEQAGTSQPCVGTVLGLGAARAPWVHGALCTTLATWHMTLNAPVQDCSVPKAWCSARAAQRSVRDGQHNIQCSTHSA